jgi:predicted nuclease of predicted toxin-antitoxin system
VTVERVALRFFLDEGVPDSVGEVLRQAGHQVTLLRESGIATGSADTVVCVTAEANDCILVAQDGDMKQLAKDRGINPGRFRTLSLLRLQCREPRAASRVAAALSLIEHEWTASEAGAGQRRLYVVIGDSMIRTHR